MKEETRLQQQIQKYIMHTYEDSFVMKVHGNKFQKIGVPDLLIIIDGRIIFIETKVGRNKPSPVQCTVIEELREAGAVADVAYSLDEAKRIIEGEVLWSI